MAPLDNTKNFVSGTVTSSINSGDTTISVDDASIYPDPSVDNYNLVVWDSGSHARPEDDPEVEIVRVTARDTSTDELTVQRGRENTSDVGHPTTSSLVGGPTAKTINDIETALNELADYSASPTSITASVDNSSTASDDVTVASQLVLPRYDDLANAPSDADGLLVYATGDGTSAEGVYKNDGTGYQQIGTGSGYTDEQAQDAVGGILSSDFTYDDGGDAINMDPHTGTSDAHHSRPTAGDGLTDNSGTFDIDASNFAGLYLEDDGSENLQVRIAEGLEDDGTGHISTEERFVYDPGMMEWEDGLSAEEVNRLVLQSGETLALDRIEFRQKGGGSSANAEVRVQDLDATTTINNATLGSTTDNPGSSATASTISIQVSNSTGGPINAAPRVIGRIQEA